MKLAVSNFEYGNMFQTNLNKASCQAGIAAQKGSEIIVFHEWFLGINPIGPIPNKVTQQLSCIAKSNKIMVVSGGIRYLDDKGVTKVAAFVFDKDGQILAVQQKINLYKNEKKWIKPGDEIKVINTSYGSIVILSGLDGMDRSFVAKCIDDIKENVDLLVFQCTEFNEEGAKAIRQIAMDFSNKLNCKAVIAGIHGFFYENQCVGESIVIDNGKITYRQTNNSEVVLGFIPSDDIVIEHPVIDSHVHIVFREPGEVVIDLKVQRLVEKSVDVPVKSAIISFMNRAKIDKSVIFDWSASLENDFITSNQKVADLSKYSDRFIGFGVPSCKDPDFVDAVYEMGVRGLKFNPSLQEFYPNDENFLKVCERASKYNLPILLHSGPESAGKLRYDLPLFIDDIAIEYPNLNIIIAHIGVRGFTSEQAIMVAEKNSNVYVETSWANEDLVKEAITKIGVDNVIFGSDFPSRNPITELAKIKKLLDDKFINEDDYFKIVGGNILKLIQKQETR